jgi:hypothetical protein
MKIAVDSQSAPFISALTSDVTHAWPAATEPGGCSLYGPFGITHDTFGKLPNFAAVKKRSVIWMLSRWRSSATASKRASGFHDEGALTDRISPGQ